MNRQFFATLMIILFLLIVAGCQNARQEWGTLRASLTATEANIDLANQSHLLSDQDFVKIKPFAIAAQGGLDEADKELIASGDKPTSKAWYYLNIVSATLSEIQPLPTTQP